MTASTSPGSADGDATPRSASLMLRILAGVAGVIVLAIGFVLSFGAILASPVGMWLERRRTRRRDRRPSQFRTLVSAVLASSVLAALLCSALFVFGPRPTVQDIESAARESQSRPVKLPDWYAKAFPRTAQTDSAAQRVIESPGFVRLTLILGIAFLALFFGVTGGVAGWGGLSLLRVAWWGRAA